MDTSKMEAKPAEATKVRIGCPKCHRVTVHKVLGRIVATELGLTMVLKCKVCRRMAVRTISKTVPEEHEISVSQ